MFEFAAPKYVMLTTPNCEYNSTFENLPPGKFRHSDHRFEWSRDEFITWSEHIKDKFGYSFIISPIGEVDSILGPPTQMAVFSK